MGIGIGHTSRVDDTSVLQEGGVDGGGLGQKDHQGKESRCDVTEDRINRKYCEQLRLEARIPGFVRGIHLQRMISYEIIKLTFGQPFNRYAWVLNPPDEVEDYSAEINYQIGNILSAITSKVVSLDATTATKTEVKKLLHDIEERICCIAAYAARMPRDQSLLEMGLEKIPGYLDELEFKDEEVCARMPWWFRSMPKGPGQDGNVPADIDLDAAIAASPEVEHLVQDMSPEERQEAMTAIVKILKLDVSSTPTKGPSNTELRRIIAQGIKGNNCPSEVKQFFLNQVPDLAKIELAAPTPEQERAAAPRFPFPPSAVARHIASAERHRHAMALLEGPSTPSRAGEKELTPVPFPRHESPDKCPRGVAR